MTTSFEAPTGEQARSVPLGFTPAIVLASRRISTLLDLDLEGEKTSR
jgi:hypothetical protein